MTSEAHFCWGFLMTNLSRLSSITSEALFCSGFPIIDCKLSNSVTSDAHFCYGYLMTNIDVLISITSEEHYCRIFLLTGFDIDVSWWLTFAQLLSLLKHIYATDFKTNSPWNSNFHHFKGTDFCYTLTLLTLIFLFIEKQFCWSHFMTSFDVLISITW